MGRTFRAGIAARHVALAVALATLTGGCTFAGRVASDPVKYNQSLADGNNRLLLLNIARASRKHPLYFTEVSEVNESIKVTSGLSGVLNDGAGDKGISPSLSAEVGPDFKMAPLASKEFMAGITTPVAPSTFAYYWEQGWPPEVLLLLLVREVTLHMEKGPDGRDFSLSLTGAFDFFGPYPTLRYEIYRVAIGILARQEMTLDTAPLTDAIGPALNPNTADPDTLRALVEMDKAGYGLEPDKDKANVFALHGAPSDAINFGNLVMERARLREGLSLVLTRIQEDREALRAKDRPTEPPDELTAQLARLQALAKEEEPPPGSTSVSKPQPKASVRVTTGGRRSARGRSTAPTSGKGGKDDEPGLEIELHLRSPEAVIYHLGELVRAQRSLGYTVLLHKRDGREVPLFSACEGGCCGVSVDYCGSTYAVNGDADHDESMHVLSFLNQLLSLHKNSEDLPKSASVRIVGGRK